MNSIQIHLPYQQRHLNSEVKQRGGKFDSRSKLWSLPDTTENREFAELIRRPVSGPTAQDRVGNVAQTCVALLNALNHRNFRLIEAGDKIVIESDPLLVGPIKTSEPATSLQAV